MGSRVVQGLRAVIVGALVATVPTWAPSPAAAADTVASGPHALIADLPRAVPAGDLRIDSVELQVSAFEDEVVAGEPIEYLVSVRQGLGGVVSSVAIESNVGSCVRAAVEVPVGAFASVRCSRPTTAADSPSVSAWFRAVGAEGPVSSTVTVETTVWRRPRPDALVRRGTGDLIGGGVYGDLSRQTVAARVRKGHPVTFTVRIQNDGPRPESMTLTVPGQGRSFTVRWFRGTEEITDWLFFGSGWTTPTIRPGGHIDVRVVVKWWRWARPGDVETQRVTITSDLDPRRKDAVGLRISVP